MVAPPVVTGLSPNEGPQGTRITIRGENFGTKSTDLIGLKICGFDCLLSAEWKSSTKIIAMSGPCKGTGDVIITTRIGGEGTCNVTFKGYFEKTIGPLKDSSVWVEEAPLFVWGRHSLSPSSYQQEDPLGLSVEGNDKKFPEDELIDLFPSGSGDIASETFSPGWFLLENHHVTSFDDLQAGMLHLRRKVDGQKEGQLSFLKANISSVIDQLDTVVVLDEKFKKDARAQGPEPTLTLEKAIKESEREARKLFDDVLTRRDRAEKTRNALNVLARFRFLFCLPCVIERNVRKGDYDIVINDYVRVKNLFNKSDAPVFKMALVEIERRIALLRETLRGKLTRMPIAVEEQKRLIRHLVNLEAAGDPAWDAIQSHSDYLGRRMRECYAEHRSAAEALQEEARAKPGAHKYGAKYGGAPADMAGAPAAALVVEELCEIVTQLFPNLWKLGQCYFTGELHARVEAGRQVEFKHMVLAIMAAFGRTLRAAIIPHTLEPGGDRGALGAWPPAEHEAVRQWLPTCLRRVRAAHAIFVRLDLPGEALGVVFAFVRDLRAHCVGVLFKQAGEQVEQLAKQETWRIELGGKHGGITELPIKFERAALDVIQVVRQLALVGEPPDDALAQQELDAQVATLLGVFHAVLAGLAAKADTDDDDEGGGGAADADASPVVSQLIGTPGGYRGAGAGGRRSAPSWERRLLTSLANCQYTRRVVLRNVEESFARSGCAVPRRALAACAGQLEQLEKSVLEYYLEEKSDPLVGTIEPSMYLERFDWDTDATPTDVRPYAKECINNLIRVHCEVNGVSPALVDSVLPQVVQTVAEELYRLMDCVRNFSVAGIQQATADIRMLRDVFAGYLSSEAAFYFDEALAAIPRLEGAADQTVVDDIVAKCKQRMRLQLLCLQRVDADRQG